MIKFHEDITKTLITEGTWSFLSIDLVTFYLAQIGQGLWESIMSVRVG